MSKQSKAADMQTHRQQLQR